MSATLIDALSIPAHTSQTGSEVLVSVTEGLAVTLTAAPASDVVGSVYLLAQFSADGATFSDPQDTGIVATLSGSNAVTVYGSVAAPAGVSVNLSARNANNEAVTVSLIALGV